MADVTTLHLKVDTDTTAAVELAPRVKAAVRDWLTAADTASLILDVVLNAEAVSDGVAAAVMAEILRVRQATPAEVAVARVRALHADDYGLCRECTNSHGVLSPCPTVRALDGEDPQS